MRTILILVFIAAQVAATLGAAAQPAIFARSNLVAWCIVPFDAKKRGPEERAQMLDRLGIKRLAYDWRAEHIPTFDAEVEACKRHGIELTAWWFPTSLDGDAKAILAVLERHKIKTQLWIMGSGEPVKSVEEQQQRVKAEASRIRPIAETAARLGCMVGLYNHGGWFGEPENQLEIIRVLGMSNVGIVYNFHHGHDHVARFPELFRKMQPHLLAVNLNGMINDGEKRGHKILHLSEGDQELGMLKVIRDSGWHGAIGIIDHRPETDSEETLRNNLRGLDWLLKELNQPGSGGPRPFKLVTANAGSPQTSAAVAAADSQRVSRTNAPTDYWAVEDAKARARLPLFQTIPAATADELMAANDFPKPATLRTRLDLTAVRRAHAIQGSIRLTAVMCGSLGSPGRTTRRTGRGTFSAIQSLWVR